jgi:hypothetical protein
MAKKRKTQQAQQRTQPASGRPHTLLFLTGQKRARKHPPQAVPFGYTRDP